MRHISVVIPALNEGEPIVGVVREIAATKVPDEIIVVDNGSTDRTAERARETGAHVVNAPRGYGRACAAGVAQTVHRQRRYRGAAHSRGIRKVR